MMIEVECERIDVCDDCASLIANGFVTDSNGDDISDAVSERQGLMWGDAVNNIVLTDEDDPYFTWHACEGCGSTLAGNRSTASVIV